MPHKRVTHLGRVVQKAVVPYELEVVLELAFRLVLLRLDLALHALEVHGVLDDCAAMSEAAPQARAVHATHYRSSPAPPTWTLA